MVGNEFKEKINNVFQHLVERGGQVTDDTLRRYEHSNVHAVDVHKGEKASDRINNAD